MEDPLNIAPRLREDLVVFESIEKIPDAPLKKSGRVKEESKAVNKELIETNEVEKPNQPSAGFEERSDKKSNDIEQSFSDELVSGKSDADNLKSEETERLGMTAAPSASTLASEISKADSFEREMKRQRDEIVNLPVLKSSSDNINKDNINFMQRNLSTEEKKEVQQLKMKVQTEKSEKTDQKSN